MKKMRILLILCLVGAMLLTACFGTCVLADSTVCTGTAQGLGGDVTVTLTLDDGVITDCTAVGDSETAGIGSVVIEQFPGKVVAGNTICIDAIAGATITSKAFVEAAGAALTSAGLNPDDYMTRAENSAKGEDVVLERDLSRII